MSSITRVVFAVLNCGRIVKVDKITARDMFEVCRSAYSRSSSYQDRIRNLLEEEARRANEKPLRKDETAIAELKFTSQVQEELILDATSRRTF